MFTQLLRTLALVALVAPAVAAQSATLAVQPGSRLWIEGNSTVRKFECKAADFDASVVATGAQAVAAVVAGEKAVRAVDVQIPAKKLDCGNGTMNGHMLKALRADAAPTIRFTVTTYELVKGAAATTVKMNGTLSLGGTEKPITVTAEAAQQAGALKVTGSKEIKLSDFGLKAPTLMMGTMKVADAVNVRFDLILKAGQPAT